MGDKNMEGEEEQKGYKRPEYQVDYNLQKEFNPVDFQIFQNIFGAYDPEGKGNIQKADFKDMMASLGIRDAAESEATEILNRVEEHKEDSLNFENFLNIFKGLKVSDAVKQELRTKAGNITQVLRVHGTIHSYSHEEKSAFVQIINHYLAGDEEINYMMPMNPDNEDLFDNCVSGILLCKLINCASPGTIFEKAINAKQNINIFQTKENLNLALNAAKSIGCTVVSIFPESIIEKKEHLVLGLIWQIIKILMLSSINLKAHPELVKLVKENEELTDLLKLPPEELLMRWVNYHLQKSGSSRRISNFSSDVKDCECYAILLNSIDPESCTKDAIQEQDLNVRAEKVIENSKKLGVDTFTRSSDLLSGNNKLHLIFAAAIFNTNPGLYATEEELYEAAALIEDDVEGTREERAFRMWINSLGIENLYINNLYEDVKDGLALLKVLDKVEPGIVDWKRVEAKPNHRLKVISNGNLVIECGKKLNFKLIGLGGTDIVDGNKKLILGYVWQLVRHATLKIIGEMTEEGMVKWANSRVGDIQISSFRDKSISTGVFLIKLLASIEPRAINWEIVTEGETDEDKEVNAKYAISVARKLGASVFCTWEDLSEVNPKMVMTFIAAAIKLTETPQQEEAKQD